MDVANLLATLKKTLSPMKVPLLLTPLNTPANGIKHVFHFTHVYISLSHEIFCVLAAWWLQEQKNEETRN
jgi:hypothetical protein